MLTRLASLFVVLALSLTFTTGATAQQSKARWQQTLVQQMEHLLDHPNPEMQAKGIELIVELSDRDDHGVNLSPLRKKLFAIFNDTTTSDEMRILALSALQATDRDATDKAATMETLTRLFRTRSGQVLQPGTS